MSASAVLAGTYGLLNEGIDLHGSLKMEAKVSQTTKGIESLFLKVVDPFFKKRPAGSEIPVAITGSYEEPHFRIDLVPKKISPEITTLLFSWPGLLIVLAA